MKPSINKILAIAVVALLIINVLLLIFIWSGKGKHEQKRPQGNGPFEAMVKELNMSEQQKSDYIKLRDEHFARVRPLFDTMRQFRISFFNMVKDSTANDDSLSYYSKRVAEKQALIDKLTFEHFKRVRTLFNGDQQRQFDAYMQKIMQRKRDTTNNKK
jgi:protein CpxP